MTEKTYEFTITIGGNDIEGPEDHMPEEVAMVLEYVAEQVREGFTSGAYPYWDLTIKNQVA